MPLPFLFSPQAAATCLAHLRAADVCEAEAAEEEGAENVAPAAAAATKGSAACAAAAGKSGGGAKKSSGGAKKSGGAAEAAAVPVRQVAGCPHELTPEGYHGLAESVRGKVPFAAAVECYAAVAAACLAKNAKLMKGAMPDPVRYLVR